jgi:hypothetical protein
VVSARGLLHVALLLCCPLVQVIELGQVGALQPSQPSSAALKLYAHAQKGAGYGDPADILTALLAAAQGEAAAAQVNIVGLRGSIHYVLLISSLLGSVMCCRHCKDWHLCETAILITALVNSPSASGY